MVHSEYSHIIHALVLFEPTPPEGTCTLFTTLIFNEVSQTFAVVGIHFFKREKCKKCSKQRKKKTNLKVSNKTEAIKMQCVNTAKERVLLLDLEW